MGGTRGLLVGVLPALLGVGVGHEPRVAVDADGLVRGGRRRPRAPAALLGPAPRHLRLLIDEVVGAPEEARPVLGAARVARNVEVNEVLVQMRPTQVATLVASGRVREEEREVLAVRRLVERPRHAAAALGVAGGALHARLVEEADDRVREAAVVERRGERPDEKLIFGLTTAFQSFRGSLQAWRWWGVWWG